MMNEKLFDEAMVEKLQTYQATTHLVVYTTKWVVKLANV